MAGTSRGLVKNDFYDAYPGAMKRWSADALPTNTLLSADASPRMSALRSGPERNAYSMVVALRMAMQKMANAIAASPGRSAMLFGPERAGLETDEVALANAIVTVPINPQFGSLNLAQAVILLAYEWSRKAALAQPPAKNLEPPAPHGELEALVGQLEAALEAKAYYHPPERMRSTKNTIRSIFTKTGWSSREVKAVRGIIRALAQPKRPRD
jgi:tRNA/rRNA methyltransferase